MAENRRPDPTRRLGVVSFLNARPLVEGLEGTPGIELTRDVPSRLPALLDAGLVDAALAPVIDLARSAGRWEIISDACIGCDGQTLTVRVFSSVPPEQITHLGVDGDSHTSVALAAVVWGEVYGMRIRTTPLQDGETAQSFPGQAVLLIGDKVVTKCPTGFAHQIDLGSAWKEMTGLPFVFAAWMQRAGDDTGDLSLVLAEARDRGVKGAAAIASRHGPAMGWPVAKAVSYLTQNLNFTLTPRHRQGMELFLELAGKWGLVPQPAQSVSA